MNKPSEISIIIPNFNRGQEVLQLIKSIKSNNFNNYDITVVDDYSTDNSVEILQQAGVSVVRHEKNAGPAVARNNGALKTRGDITSYDEFSTPIEDFEAKL